MSAMRDSGRFRRAKIRAAGKISLRSLVVDLVTGGDVMAGAKLYLSALTLSLFEEFELVFEPFITFGVPRSFFNMLHLSVAN